MHDKFNGKHMQLRSYRIDLQLIFLLRKKTIKPILFYCFLFFPMWFLLLLLLLLFFVHSTLNVLMPIKRDQLYYIIMYFGGRVNVGFFLRNATGKHDPWRREISTMDCFFPTSTLSMSAVDVATIPVAAAEKLPISSCLRDTVDKKRIFRNFIYACVFHFTPVEIERTQTKKSFYDLLIPFSAQTHWNTHWSVWRSTICIQSFANNAEIGIQ